VPGRVLLLVAVACLIACDSGANRAGPRSLFLIVVDTLRADRISGRYAEAPATPHVDALADRGVSFQNAHAVASWTLPSMAAMLLSRWPRELGMVERADDPRWRGRAREQRRLHRMRIGPEAGSLATRLRAAGYATAAFVNQPMLAPRRGFDRGFDRWMQAVDDGRIVRRAELGPALRQGWGSLHRAFHNDSLLVDAFAAWLRSLDADTPVFAWIHLLTPHKPYGPPERFAPDAESPGPQALYDAEVRAVDALVGRAVAAIDATRGGGASAIVLTSDHGEAFGEHGEFEHGNTLHAEVMRVPLILAAPGAVPRGEAIDAVVCTLDVAPTLLELAGLGTPAVMRGDSLLPMLSGAAAQRAFVAEGMLYGASERVWIEGGWKLLVDEAEAAPALYAVHDDREETRDRFEEEAARAHRMLGRLESHLAAGPPGRGPAGGPDGRGLDALRALGYTEGPSP
jgi:arylsulfatase A-like enzyme